MVPEQGRFLAGCARWTATGLCFLHRSMVCLRAGTDPKSNALLYIGKDAAGQGDFLRNGISPPGLEPWASAPSWEYTKQF